jgi:DNA-binding NarL/FixJ family response regulator
MRDPTTAIVTGPVSVTLKPKIDAKCITVVTVEQHAIVLEAILARISAQDSMIPIGAETSATRGLRAIAECQPDVVVIAIPLSDMNGLVLAGRVINDHPGTKVVILSMHEDRALVQQALQVGVSGYVSKRSPIERLLEAIVAAAEGACYIDPAIVARTLRAPSCNRSYDDPPSITDSCASLTKQETDTVRLTALGYTAKEIAVQLGVSAKSVETVKSRVTEKLDLRTRPQLVRYAAAQGWLSRR